MAPEVDLSAAPLLEDAGGGDAVRGSALFGVTCAPCHGPQGEGTQHGVPLAPHVLSAADVVFKVRRAGLESGPPPIPGAGGRMAYWGAERLSDAELKDLVAHLEAWRTP